MIPRIKSFGTLTALAALCVLSAPAAYARWAGDPTPHDGRHLIVIRPEAFQDAGGRPLEPHKASAAAFGQTIRVEGEAHRAFTVKHAGRYTLWVRVADDRLHRGLDVEVRSAQEALLTGRVNDGPGSRERGGKEGYLAYRLEAMKRGPDGRATGADAIDTGDDGGLHGMTGAIIDDLAPDRKEKWGHFMRVEKVAQNAPHYWWRVGTADLEPGRHGLLIRGKTGEFDAAFLSTCANLVYPFAGDVAPPAGSYIRFRIDRVPEGGVAISARMRIHYAPWSTGVGRFGPAGQVEGNVPHTKAGLTRWYRLQDIENAPGFGGAEAHLLLSVTDGAEGATQFAVFPHQDAVLREIDWDEPEGKRISMVMDFAGHLHKLRTFRDHARENYERALNATGGRIFPLTRGPLYLGNAWGYANGPPADYMVKTLRMLGFNCTSCSDDTVANRRRYGWTSHAGQYWPPTFLPFDEQKALDQYEAHYRNAFAKNRELMEGVTIYQVADEPGEIARKEMTAPLWSYVAEQNGGPEWVDLAGSSELYTRKTDYENVVLEGKVAKYGNWFGFRVGTDDARNPKQFGWWRIGKVAYDRTMNVASGTTGGGESVRKRDGASIGAMPTPFRIVYETTGASLFLNGRLIHRITGLRKRGGFGFFGPSKVIAELKLRPIARDEQGAAAPSLDKDIDEAEEPGLLDLESELAQTPQWAEDKPLEQRVREDWVVAGGMPQAHAAFRRWAAEQGLDPTLFGKKTWDEVRMLTVAGLTGSGASRRRYYWGRRYSAYLTPRMFAMAAEALRAASPNKKLKGFVALSGHSLYMRQRSQPLDMFQLAQYGGALMPGISDWMSMGSWRWDSHQAVAFSVAPYNGGARVYGGGPPKSFPMMHCVWPSQFRAYTMLANNVKYISYYNYGPYYMVTEGFWSEGAGSYHATHVTNNRAAQVDDILAGAWMRPSRVAMLYSMSNEYWDPHASFADKRAAWLGLSHEYFRPEMINEDHVAGGALAHYDALYVLDPVVRADAQDRIAEWLKGGGLLWTCADAMTRNEFHEPADFLARELGLKRTFSDLKRDMTMTPQEGETRIPRQDTPAGGAYSAEWPGAGTRARYGDGKAAWLEKAVGEGRAVYLLHRCGLSYTRKAVRLGGAPVIWADTGREPLVLPLKEAGIERELVLSQPCVVASPMSTPAGTVIVLYNMQGRGLKDLSVSLKEARPPVSVQTFDGMTLSDLPFEHRAGQVRITLPSLGGAQMVLVRRHPAPADNRLDTMKAKTVSMLGSDDWRDLSAGAWFAGFFPDWDLRAKLPPLLEHENASVRRAAAESIGRLRYPAADALAARIAVETDAHALGDQVHALALLGDERLPALALGAAARRRAFVRQQAMRAAQAFLGARAEEGPLPGGLEAFGLAMHEAAASDNDRRVSRYAVPLLSVVAPDRCLAMLRGSYATGEPAGRHAALLDAVVGDERLFTQLMADLPAGALLAVASRRADPRLARMVAEHVEELLAQNAAGVARCAYTQLDPTLTRAVFARRDRLSKADRGRIALLLERTFGARLGNDLQDWAAWLNAP